MSVEAWQLCILVTTAIVLTEIAVDALLRRRGGSELRKPVRTIALGLLAILTIVVGVVALGPSLADQLASVAAAVSTTVALWLTYRSYYAAESSNGDGTGAPKATATPSSDNALAVSTGPHRDDNAKSP